MTAELAFLLPSERQARTLERCVERHAVVVTHPDVPYGERLAGDARFTVVGHDGGTPAPARVVCMNELAVYYASTLRDHDPGFDAACFRTILKSEAAAALGSRGVATPRREVLGELPAKLPAEPPFVVKPDFGFASDLVRVIRDRDGWIEYRTAALDAAAFPLRRRYATELFGEDADQVLRRYVVEPFLEGWSMVSLPFAVAPEGAVAAYPVDGVEAGSSARSDFLWMTFSAPSAAPHGAQAVLTDLATRLRDGFSLAPGVYECELLLAQDGRSVRVLEFSPRPTGGLVPDLVWHALGIDIDALAVELALGRDVRLAPPWSRQVLGRRRRAASDAADPAEHVLQSRERRGAHELVIDEIVTRADRPVRV